LADWRSAHFAVREPEMNGGPMNEFGQSGHLGVLAENRRQNGHFKIFTVGIAEHGHAYVGWFQGGNPLQFVDAVLNLPLSAAVGAPCSTSSFFGMRC